MSRVFLFLLISSSFLLFPSCTSSVNSYTNSNEALKAKIAERGRSLELDTPYSPPPGKAENHHASGFAKVLCSAVFITGLDFDFAAEAIGYFTSPYDERLTVLKKELDLEEKKVHVTLSDGTIRTAVYTGDQGCICLPIGAKDLYFTPQKITSSLPEASITPWPLGDVLPNPPFPVDLDVTKINEAVDAAFDPLGGLTAAFAISYRGQLIAERYKPEIEMNTPLESWSMGKSLTAILMGSLIQQGVYALDQPAPIPEWQEGADPRKEIKIKDIMRMSSGIKCKAPLDPDFDPEGTYPDHLYLYTGSVNSYEYVANLPQQWAPNTVGRYRNSDPVLANYLVRLGVEGKGLNYHSYPQKTIFDKIGVRNMVMETDPYGNFLLQGYEFASARDWIRLGNLVLNDGRSPNGEQLLYKGYLDHSMETAPAWLADNNPIYGGNFMWVNGDKTWPLPKETIYMAGAGGQFTIIVPSHDLVIVRLGHYKGSSLGVKSLKNALALVMKAFE